MHPVIARPPGPGPPGAFAYCAGQVAQTGGSHGGQARCGAAAVCGSLQLDIEKTRSLLDWTPPLSLDEGLRRAAGLDSDAARGV